MPTQFVSKRREKAAQRWQERRHRPQHGDEISRYGDGEGRCALPAIQGCRLGGFGGSFEAGNSAELRFLDEPSDPLKIKAVVRFLDTLEGLRENGEAVFLF